MKPGRAVGTDGWNAEVVQSLSMRGSLLLWCILNVTAWANSSPKTWTLFSCMSSEGPCSAEGSATQGGSLAPGVPGCDVGQGGLQRLPATHSPGQNSQSHPLRLVPRTLMHGHDPDCEASHGVKQDVARQATGHDQSG